MTDQPYHPLHCRDEYLLRRAYWAFACDEAKAIFTLHQAEQLNPMTVGQNLRFFDAMTALLMQGTAPAAEWHGSTTPVQGDWRGGLCETKKAFRKHMVVDAARVTVNKLYPYEMLRCFASGAECSIPEFPALYAACVALLEEGRADARTRKPLQIYVNMLFGVLCSTHRRIHVDFDMGDVVDAGRCIMRTAFETPHAFLVNTDVVYVHSNLNRYKEGRPNPVDEVRDALVGMGVHHTQVSVDLGFNGYLGEENGRYMMVAPGGQVRQRGMRKMNEKTFAYESWQKPL